MSTEIVRSHQKSKPAARRAILQRVQQDDSGRIDWFSAVEQIRQSSGLVEDKDLAATLSVPVSTFSEFRNSAGNLPWLAKLRVLHLLGYQSLEEVLTLLTEEESADKTRRKLQRQARKIAAQEPNRGG
jgi:hypothetical protein